MLWENRHKMIPLSKLGNHQDCQMVFRDSWIYIKTSRRRESCLVKKTSIRDTEQILVWNCEIVYIYICRWCNCVKNPPLVSFSVGPDLFRRRRPHRRRLCLLHVDHLGYCAALVHLPGRHLPYHRVCLILHHH